MNMKLVLMTYMNRSGSTYLANLLSSSKDIFVCPEADAPVRLYLEDPGKRFLPGRPGREWIREAFQRDTKMLAWNLPEELPDDPGGADNSFWAFSIFLEKYAGLKKPGASTVVFKAERIAAIMPELGRLDTSVNLKFISLVRDPRAVLASQMNTVLPGASGPMTSSPVRTALQWKKYAGRVSESRVRPARHLIIRYEDMIADPGSFRNLLSDFLELTLEGTASEKGQLLDMIPKELAAVHSLAGKPPKSGRIDAWKNMLSGKHVYLTEKVCGKMMDDYQYGRTQKRFRPCLEGIRIWQTTFYLVRELSRKLAYHAKRMFRPGRE